jgi:predicted regulator of Ras-like GTPase activity (Roadblock/LC7/MglB family)
MKCKIVRIQKLMWHNIMRSTKSQKTSVLYYSIDIDVALGLLAIAKSNIKLITLI